MKNYFYGIAIFSILSSCTNNARTVHTRMKKSLLIYQASLLLQKQKKDKKWLHVCDRYHEDLFGHKPEKGRFSYVGTPTDNYFT